MEKVPQSNNVILPSRVVELLKNCPWEGRNPSLQLDKYSNSGTQEEQSKALLDVIKCRQDNQLLEMLLKKRETWLKSLHTVRFAGTTLGPLTLHLSGSGALENAGIAMHPTYGFVWLPGSGIKGMTRAYAETVWKLEQNDESEAQRIILEVFGYSDESNDAKQAADSNRKEASQKVGRLIFHDAWPINWPKLELDVITNHNQKYYSEYMSGKKNPTGDLLGDWDSPVPVKFLTIAAGTKFDFAISDRKQQDSELLDIASNWLRNALLHFGAGAKTAAGYGRIQPEGEVRTTLPEKYIKRGYDLELVTPAFLTGANQDVSDCDLRVPSLRGLLRWWWRTMHANSLNLNELSTLEESIWGSVDSSSPISISILSNSKENPATEFNKEEVRNKFDLERPKNKKVIQGLYYTSYGMDEVNVKKGNNQKRRHYRNAGDSWTLHVTAKDTNSEKFGKITSKELMNQFEASLWLLTNYGGVGSKSLKGFGSFQGLKFSNINNIEDCIAIGKNFRDSLGLTSGGQSKSASLEKRVGPLEISTDVANSWHALNRIGDIYQAFIKEIKPKAMRKAFGLPRNFRVDPDVKFTDKERHSSPAHWSLIKKDDNTLTVRLLSFPSDHLPDFQKNREILVDLENYVKEEFQKQIGASNANSRPGSRHKASNFKTNLPLTGKEGLPKANSTVKAVLLEEKTKKGKWKVNYSDGVMIGSIENSEDVPSDKKPGDEVELLVAAAHKTNANFKWPKTDT